MHGNGDAGGLVLLLLMAFLGLPALFAVVAALLPGYVERSRTALRAHPGRSGLVGLFSLMALLGLAYLCFATNWTPLQAAGTILFFALAPVGVMLGLLLAACLVGETVWQQLLNRPINRLVAVILGTVLLGLLILVPVFGWLLILILMLVGLGGAITALLPSRRPSAAAEPPPA